MLRKVIDEFDIDTYGWFDDSTPTTSDYQYLTKHCQDVWSLWVKSHTAFKFATLNDCYHHSAVLPLAESTYYKLQQYHKYVRHYDKTPRPDQDVIRDLLSDVQHDNYQCTEDFAQRGAAPTEDRVRWVYLPNNLIHPKTVAAVGDHYLLADAITGLGLETMEAANHALIPLGRTGLDLLDVLRKDRALTTPSTPPLRERQAVIADCVLDIWWALQIREVRDHILSLWPGWSDIFVTQDSVLMPTAASMQSAVNKKSPYRSELRRFCMTLAWNLNQHNTRLKFHKSFDTVYQDAIKQWPSIMTEPNDDGKRLLAIMSFVSSLANNLSYHEEIPEKQTPLFGSDTQNLVGKPNKFRSNNQRDSHRPALEVVPHQPSSKDSESNDNAVVPGVILPPRDWQRVLATRGERYGPYLRHLRDDGINSRKFQAQYRKAISDEISASAWFVPNPPPLEHGNLDGVLDEGNLLRYAAFSDPNIFSIRPDSGAGQIAIGILVDASGSMSYTDQKFGVTCLQVALCFVGGLRDGLARNPNVKVEAFAFDSQFVNADMSILGDRSALFAQSAPGVRDHAIVCALQRLDTEDDLAYTQPGGGTPTTSALYTLDKHLAATYPEAQRIILILTDGEPGAYTVHPYVGTNDKEQRFNDSTSEVRQMVSSISTPTFCIGLNVDGSALQAQYNVGHWFSVESAMDSVKVACDLVRGIGQSFNC